MTAREKIERFLCDNSRKAYCDDCLSAVLDIHPRQQVQQKTSQLAVDNRYWRQSGICARCGDVKKVIRLRLARPAEFDLFLTLDPRPRSIFIEGPITIADKFPLLENAFPVFYPKIRCSDVLAIL